jgi:two-component system, LytTR family, response regulator
MSYRVVIADDEPLARRGIRSRLRAHPAFSVQRECASGREALAAIAELRPDLVFLDVQMPEMSGLDVARAIGTSNLPVVIFTTAFDHYALAAFEAHAIAYLLKPIDDARFTRALERARTLIEGSSGEPDQDNLQTRRAREASATAPSLERFWVKTRGKVILVPVADVDWIGAEGDYVRLHVADKSYLINESLTSLEDRLAPSRFARIHRSAIANLRRVAELRSHQSQDHIMRLTTGVELRLSRTYYQRVVERMR